MASQKSLNTSKQENEPDKLINILKELKIAGSQSAKIYNQSKVSEPTIPKPVVYDLNTEINMFDDVNKSFKQTAFAVNKALEIGSSNKILDTKSQITNKQTEIINLEKKYSEISNELNSLKLEMMYDTDLSQALYLTKDNYEKLSNNTELITVSGDTSKLTKLHNIGNQLKETIEVLEKKKEDFDTLKLNIGDRQIENTTIVNDKVIKNYKKKINEADEKIEKIKTQIEETEKIKEYLPSDSEEISKKIRNAKSSLDKIQVSRELKDSLYKFLENIYKEASKNFEDTKTSMIHNDQKKIREYITRFNISSEEMKKIKNIQKIYEDENTDVVNEYKRIEEYYKSLINDEGLINEKIYEESYNTIIKIKANIVYFIIILFFKRIKQYLEKKKTLLNKIEEFAENNLSPTTRTDIEVIKTDRGEDIFNLDNIKNEVLKSLIDKTDTNYENKKKAKHVSIIDELLKSEKYDKYRNKIMDYVSDKMEQDNENIGGDLKFSLFFKQREELDKEISDLEERKNTLEEDKVKIEKEKYEIDENESKIENLKKTTKESLDRLKSLGYTVSDDLKNILNSIHEDIDFIQSGGNNFIDNFNKKNKNFKESNNNMRDYLVVVEQYKNTVYRLYTTLNSYLKTCVSACTFYIYTYAVYDRRDALNRYYTIDELDKKKQNLNNEENNIFTKYIRSRAISLLSALIEDIKVKNSYAVDVQKMGVPSLVVLHYVK